MTGESTLTCDFCVIGGGIAGLSAAAELARRHRVVLVERETVLAYHATGRSAALYAPSYGNAVIRALTRASRAPLEDVGRGNGPAVLAPRGELLIAREDQRPSLARIAGELAATGQRPALLEGSSLRSRCPALAPDIVAGLLDEAAHDLDAAALVEHYRQALAGRRGQVLRAAEVTAIAPRGDGWRVTTGSARLDCVVVVNAAGAWADTVAALACGEPLPDWVAAEGVCEDDLSPARLRREPLAVSATVPAAASGRETP
jgi:D-arginine dehydrogenase